MKFALLTASLLLASGAQAQHAMDDGYVSETGQSQFAAIAEIVGVLQADDATDWESINITALRNHLVDMDNVTTGASAKTNTTGLTVTFDITGDPVVAASIQRMVTAHGPMLSHASGWEVVTTKTEHGATLAITAQNGEDLDQIQGLGFWGVMTIGAHHQQHHEMIARGQLSH